MMPLAPPPLSPLGRRRAARGGSRRAGNCRTNPTSACAKFAIDFRRGRPRAESPAQAWYVHLRSEECRSVSINIEAVHPRKLAAVRREVALGSVGSAWGPALSKV